MQYNTVINSVEVKGYCVIEAMVKLSLYNISL